MRRVLRFVILKVLSKNLVLQIKLRNIVESCSLDGISVRKTEKKESIFLFMYEIGYSFNIALVPIFEEH